MASHLDRGSPSSLGSQDSSTRTVEAETDQPRTTVYEPEPEPESGSESESGSSYDGTASDTRSPVCQFRNSQYYDDECSLFFDCPTHQIQRAPADAVDTSHQNLDPAANLAPNNEQPSDSDPSAPLRNDADPSNQVSPVGPSTRHETVATTNAQQPSPPTAVNLTAHAVVSNDSHTSDDVFTALEALRMLGTSTNRATDTATATHGQPTGNSIARNTHGSASSSRASSRLSLRPENPMSRPDDAHPLSPANPHALARDGRRRGNDVTLPVWQDDSDVASCPICRTDFTLWTRRHHCRKCGRVVCNNCSPHRIVIPNQYIVRPPGEMPLEFYLGERGLADFGHSLGGGERVRLCNPCVPDPNTTPPQPQPSPLGSSAFHPRSGHQRSQSSADGNGYFFRGASGLHSPPPAGATRSLIGTQPRSRSATVNHLPSQQLPTAVANHHLASRGYREPPIASGSSFSAQSSTGSFGSRPSGLTFGSFTSAQRFDTPRSQSNTQAARYFPSDYNFLSPRSGTAPRARDIDRPLPLPPHPAPDIPEEDQCPICHDELPSRQLSDFERLREEHITSCIEEHSTSRPRPPNPAGQAGAPGVAPAPAPAPAPARAQRLTGMITYVATEKDCKRDTNGNVEECTICFEEYRPGVKMARLECWCHFHYDCITEWFRQSGPGHCPTHQHGMNSPGY